MLLRAPVQAHDPSMSSTCIRVMLPLRLLRCDNDNLNAWGMHFGFGLRLRLGLGNVCLFLPQKNGQWWMGYFFWRAQKQKSLLPQLL